MTTIERTPVLPEKTKPTPIESVTFRDGMIVTAEDLDAAMRYPASLLHIVLRAFLGCGVVCGLTLRPKESGSWVLCVDRGVAIDCHGHPIELCAPVELDLSPDACACELPPATVCIAVRRVTSDEAPRDPCSCDLDEPRFDCRRVRDHVRVKAFTVAEIEALPVVCQRTADDAKVPICTALTACSPVTCGECWVLLGCVTLDKDRGIVGVTLDPKKGVGGAPDVNGRRWVKPVEALCAGLVPRIDELQKRIDELEKEVKGLKPEVALSSTGK
jgi:hypothetical protein